MVTALCTLGGICFYLVLGVPFTRLAFWQKKRFELGEKFTDGDIGFCYLFWPIWLIIQWFCLLMLGFATIIEAVGLALRNALIEGDRS